MMDDTKTTEQNGNEDLDNAPDLTDDDIAAVKDEETRNRLSSTAAQKKHWRDKATKAEEARKALETERDALKNDPRLKVEAKKPDAKADGKSFDPDEFEARLLETQRIQRKYPDLSDEQLSEARALAKTKGKKVTEIVDSKFFQTYLKSQQDEIEAEKSKASPSTRTGSGTSGYTVKDLADAKKVREMPLAVFEKLSNEAGKR